MSFLVPILVFFNLAWLGYLTFLIYRRNLSTKSASQPLSLDKLAERLDKLEVLAAEMKQNGLTDIQKVGLYRFNPFEDTGGDQSFTLAMLDGHNNGVIVTSLHNRDNTRIYAKAVKNGEGSGISLSKDEKLAIVKAIKG